MPLPLARWQLPLALGAAASGGAGTWQLPTRWQLPLALGISGRQVRAERWVPRRRLGSPSSA